MSVDTHNQAQAIELGPPITDQGMQASSDHPKTDAIEMSTTNDHEQKALPASVEQMASRSVTTQRNPETEQEKESLPSHSTSLPDRSSPTPPPIGSPRSADAALDRHEKRSSGAHAQSNAMLKLPPPLPFDLRVSKLWVGVPQSGPSR